MKKYFIFCFMFVTILVAQHKLSHPLNTAVSQVQRSAANDTLKILAILVQFVPDTDPRTSDSGRFDLSTIPQRIIDAPPRDSAYFADHFLFAKNYFLKASNGKQKISSTVLGKVITLSKQMKEYAPVSGNASLVQMIEESWKKADTLYSGFPFQNYDLFIVFHAGSGKDIDLVATLGYDPTPLDIPSLYFNLEGFKKTMGSSYTGILLPKSGFTIKNTVVLPETENRKLPAINGDFLLKLSINGLLVSSIASHIGLPDLFDTKTGKTAIGRFGLMDGQAIFSFSGICPPEPSAWEKAYLGWTTPIIVTENKPLRVPAVGMYQTGNDTVYRMSISAKEYFLVENRQRDVDSTGQTVTMRWNGQTITKKFVDDGDTFNNTNIDSVYGVVIDVDELDWNLPGYKSSKENYMGGILVWHIDETIIEKNLATNSINANPNFRGVDVEEADGSQDIGQTYEFGQAGSGSEDGTALDYWYEKNPSPVNKNEFSESTNPNSLSNSFAKSHISLKNFSVSKSVMTFDAYVGDANVALVKTIKRKNIKPDNNDAPIAVDINSDGKEELLYTSGDSIYVLKNDDAPFLNNGTGLFSKIGGKFQPTVLPIEKNIVGVNGNQVMVLKNIDADNDSSADVLYTVSLSSPITTPLVTYISNAQSHIVIGTNLGKRFDINFATRQIDSSQEFTSSITGISFTDQTIVSSLDSIRLASVKKGFDGRKIRALSVTKINEAYALFDDNSFAKFPLNSLNEIVYTKIQNPTSNAFAVADLDGDGKGDIVTGNSSGVFAYSENGVMLENFPLKILDGGNVVGSPIIVKLFGSNETAIIFGSSNGHLFAYTSKGKLMNGFPLQTGGIVSSPVLWGNKLVVASSDSSIYIWNVGAMFDTSKILWRTFLSDNYHLNLVQNPGTTVLKSSELLPKSFAYNWPNPVYEGMTNIRYFLGKAATVKIRIINMAGELVDELTGTGYANLDNEVQWNVSNVQSGIYFAEITANGNGETKSQIVKIAVVK